MKTVAISLLFLCLFAAAAFLLAPRQASSSPGATTMPSTPPNAANAPIPTLQRTEAEWRKLLTPEQYHILREKGTEAPFTNKFDEHFEKGTYSCAACNLELFTSDTKFNSGCGWPAFYAAQAGDRIKQTTDLSHGMVRIEVTCARCGSHLGHLFDDAPQTPTGQRFCINSVSLTFTPATAAPPAATQRR